MSRKHIVWFSCGAASAVAAKIASEQFKKNLHVVYCNTLSTEHPDNLRFLKDVESWIGLPVEIISSTRYVSIDDVFERTKYMAGPLGARCTVEMKKLPREHYQGPDDTHIFGYTVEEKARRFRFEENNPSLNVCWILAEHNINKQECYERLWKANIELPTMYRLGYDHNNCIGCVKASSAYYWQKIRKDFPEVFAKRADQSRRLGAKLVRYKGERIFLDELPNEQTEYLKEDIECGPVCQLPLDWEER